MILPRSSTRYSNYGGTYYKSPPRKASQARAGIHQPGQGSCEPIPWIKVENVEVEVSHCPFGPERSFSSYFQGASITDQRRLPRKARITEFSNSFCQPNTFNSCKADDTLPQTPHAHHTVIALRHANSQLTAFNARLTRGTITLGSWNLEILTD